MPGQESVTPSPPAVPSDFFIMIMAMLDFMLLQFNSFSFVYHQSVFRIFKVFKSLRALRAIRVLRRLRSAGPRLPTLVRGLRRRWGHRPGQPACLL